jgi:predicted GNAT family acetyltransferase
VTVTVADAPGRARYEASVHGGLAGFVVYRREPGVITLVHTEVEPDYEGKGVGSALARAALDEARAAGLRVVPACPFVAGWIDHHPDYDDLVLRSGIVTD